MCSKTKLWGRVVWREPRGEEEGVIPMCWVIGREVRWPAGKDATKALREMQEPSSTWKRFPMIKIKHTSGKYTSCNTISFISWKVHFYCMNANGVLIIIFMFWFTGAIPHCSIVSTKPLFAWAFSAVAFLQIFRNITHFAHTLITQSSGFQLNF